MANLEDLMKEATDIEYIETQVFQMIYVAWAERYRVRQTVVLLEYLCMYYI